MLRSRVQQRTGQKRANVRAMSIATVTAISLGVALGSATWEGYASCADYPLTPAEEAVVEAFIAYYGRPPDPGGMRFWAERMQEGDGTLESIMLPFGNSAEYQARFGQLSSESLVENLFVQMFDRLPDEQGRDYYVAQLESGQMGLVRIALDIFYGASGEDISVFEG